MCIRLFVIVRLMPDEIFSVHFNNCDQKGTGFNARAVPATVIKKTGHLMSLSRLFDGKADRESL